MSAFSLIQLNPLTVSKIIVKSKFMNLIFKTKYLIVIKKGFSENEPQGRYHG